MADKKFDKINSVEALEAKLVEIRAAEEVWATFPQEKVDAICEAAAMAADKMRIPLAKMAHEETKAGSPRTTTLQNMCGTICVMLRLVT